MRKLMFIAVAITFAACSQKTETTVKKEAASPAAEAPKADVAPVAEVEYTCSMHPEVSGKKGEKCPKCGMDLVPRK